MQGLKDFIEVPNLSPNYDADFMKNGKIEQAMACIDKYAKLIQIKGIERKIFGGKKDGRPPMTIYTIPATGGSKKSVMLYGHLDK